jgi:hypothetical protein
VRWGDPQSGLGAFWAASTVPGALGKGTPGVHLGRPHPAGDAASAVAGIDVIVQPHNSGAQQFWGKGHTY